MFTRAAPAFHNLFMACVFDINTVHKTVEKLKNRQSRTTCSYFCRREIKNRNGLACNPDKMEVDDKITYSLAFKALLFLVLIDVGGYIRSPTPAPQDLRVLVDSHLMLSKHVNSVCMAAFFSVSDIGRIGKYLDCDQCFLLYLKLKLSFMRTDHSLPGPLDFEMHYR